ncbi:KGGVGR-motif variant AAA ATPase [Vibrio sp. Sgm 5]|uniref:KGGVGR-motif variant AAA ATPase n=1 Tax=Vibrio sp. Sgm 5 TaxID=2994387 RepID=UPI002248D22E|nr:AAA family ATPase [Vibrio sp. Sgm 5]MCX2791506.1 AAA family ATPase [Vibrio sp. Sgm 5]
MILSFKILDEIKEELTKLLYESKIIDFSIDLSMNQNATVTVVSDEVNSLDSLLCISEELKKHEKYNINYSFISKEDYEDDSYSYLFKSDKVNYGLRRGFNNLLDGSEVTSKKNTPLVTFFSYKGGVGRTTSLALFAGYYANLGKKVFVIDCDFEAPGLLNFFGISQFANPKSGVVEYLVDKKFSKDMKLDENYVYEISASYSGEGRINLLPAGDIFGDSKYYYLEALSRVDLQGKDIFLKDFDTLLKDIEEEYEPDVILVDSRTGFNNVFGSLTELSDITVGLCGDDQQNIAGIEFLLERFNEKSSSSKLCMVLSIVSSSVTTRFRKFTKKIEEYCDDDITIPTFYFQRESMLELVGTEYEDIEDTKFFMSSSSSTSYSKFFDFLVFEIDNISGMEDEPINDEPSTAHDEAQNTINNNLDEDITLESKSKSYDVVVQALKENMPDPYAENIAYNNDFFNNDFYIRQCMLDLFLNDYNILLGGKGTGKTAFYKALQNNEFFNIMVERAEKKHLNYNIIHAIDDAKSKNSRHFEVSNYLKDYLGEDNKMRKFWTVYLWLTVYKTEKFGKSNLSFDIKNDHHTSMKFKEIVESDDKFLQIENELKYAEDSLRRNDERLIVTFDQLDFVVDPSDWSLGISPLIRLCSSFNFDRIQPKLFLRRDLYSKLGNLTNKNALESKIINLEWSHEEMYAFLFKIIFAYSKEAFLECLEGKVSEGFIKSQILARLTKKNQFNQLPADEHILRKLTEVFFGSSQSSWNNAYDELYTNIKNADQTISLRPFLDLIRLGIEQQIRDGQKLRKDCVLSIHYCMYKNVREQAVDRHFNDLALEAGNEVIKFFVEDIRNSKVDDRLKCSSLLQAEFEELVEAVKRNHPSLNFYSTTHFEDMLVLNGIVFITYISGGRKKYSFAFLYKYYLGLKSPKRMRKSR